MRNIVFTIRMHPNEEVAVEMANQVAMRLRDLGRTVTIVDLEALRRSRQTKSHWAAEYSRDHKSRVMLLMDAMRTYEGEFFDFHDSPPEGMKQHFGTVEPSLELTRGGYHLVETPAVNVAQEDPEVSIHVEGERLMNRYFTRRSDIDLSREAGYLSPERVECLATNIYEIVMRMEQYQ